jgi:hypothetical protein
MPPTAGDVRETLGSTELSDAAITTKIEQASRLYAQRIDGEHVEDAVREDVVEYLAAHLIKAGPEPEVTGGDGTEFRIPDEGRFWRMATTLDPTGQLGGDEDGGSDHFTLST